MDGGNAKRLSGTILALESYLPTSDRQGWPLSHVLDRCSRRGSTSSIHGVVCFAAPVRLGAMVEMQKDCREQSLPWSRGISGVSDAVSGLIRCTCGPLAELIVVEVFAKVSHLASLFGDAFALEDAQRIHCRSLLMRNQP